MSDDSVAQPVRKFVVRAAVKSGAVVGSAVWRIWKGTKNDHIFIAPSNIAGAVKGSLHTSGYCHFGLTDQEARKIIPADASSGRPMLSVWERARTPPDGATKAMSVLIAHEFLSPGEPISSNVSAIDDPGPGKAVSLDLCFSRAALSRALTPSQRELGSVALKSGEYFSVIADVIDFDIRDFSSRYPAAFKATGVRMLSVGQPNAADRAAIVVCAAGYDGFRGVIDIGGIKCVSS